MSSCRPASIGKHERNGRSGNSSGGIAMGSHAEWWQKRLPGFHVPYDGSNRSNRMALLLYALHTSLSLSRVPFAITLTAALKRNG